MINDDSAVALELQQVQIGEIGSIAVPTDHDMTVESRLDLPFTIRYLFGFSVVAVVGAAEPIDIVGALDDTFTLYVDNDARWTTNAVGMAIAAPDAARHVAREFTWTNDYLEMRSIVNCLSDDQHSLVVHGSCPTNVGAAEAATLRAVVMSAKLT